MFKVEKINDQIVITHCGEIVRVGFRWVTQAEEVAEKLNKEHGYE